MRARRRDSKARGRSPGCKLFYSNPFGLSGFGKFFPRALDYLLSHDLQANAAACGEIIIGGLKEAAKGLKTVADVRGKGLMFAVDMADPATGKPAPALAAKVLEACKKRGLLVGKGGLYGATLRMAPPLTLTQDEALEGLGLLVDALTYVDNGMAG